MFKRYEHNPILSPKADSPWESMSVCNPGVWYENGVFTMLYRAAGHDKAHRIHLGLATSTDGFNFTRMATEPVLSPDPDGYDAGCVEDPRIVKFGTLFYVTYAYRPFPPGRYWLEESYDHGWPLDGHAPQGLRENTTNTALAITQDFQTFKKLGRITPHAIDNRDVILFPEKIDGRYVMLHRPVEWTGAAFGCENPSIFLAYSDDLMQWQDDVLLIKGEATWESKKIGGSTPPLKTDRGWLVLYHGVDTRDNLYRLGALLLDLNDPRIIIGRTQEALMTPETSYETDGFYEGCIFPTGNIVKDGVLYIYYGGADRYVCAATCDLNTLLDHLSGLKK